MSSVTDGDPASNSAVLNKDLNIEVHAAAVCNSLALLVSQSSPKNFKLHIAVLSALQKCWLNGHLILRLECSSDGAIDCASDVMHDLNTCNTLDSEIHLTREIIDSVKNCDNMDNIKVEPLHSNISLQSECLSASEKSKNVRKKRRHQADVGRSCDATVHSESSTVIARSACTICDVCCRRFTSSWSLAKHIRHVHKTEQHQMPGNSILLKNSAVPEVDNEQINESASDPQKSQFVCTACGRQFRLRQLLAAHSVTHTGARPAACRFPGCGKRFGQTSTRNSHERTHSDIRPYVCSECGQSFKQPTIFKTHIATVHGNGARPHQCSQCGKTFKLYGALRTHYKSVHLDERPHSCTECSKRFKYQSQLVRHQRALHWNEHPWHCSVCDKTFTQPSNLRTHMRVHTGEKPYSCSICGQNFAHSGTLKGHMATHCSLSKHTNVLPCHPRTNNSTSVAMKLLY